MSAAIDWAALSRLGGIALAVATAIALATWWRQALARRGPRERLAALTALTLFLCFDLVVFGAFTRLTDSGLGCPDWPGCYAQASPIGAAPAIAQAEHAMPQGPVNERKAWIEMIHRYLAGAVGLLIIALAVLGWLARREQPRAWALPLVSLGWVIAQGLFGQWTVTWKLYPAIVTAHLLGGMGLLALLALQHRQLRRGPADARPGRSPAWFVAVGALAVQIGLGGWVSTNYAVLACTGFPGCSGQGWPTIEVSNWSAAFTFARELGHRADGSGLQLGDLIAIHWAHRLFALAVVLALAGYAMSLRAQGPQARRLALWVCALLAGQLASGLSNVVLGWPLLAALAHTAGAAALVVCLGAFAVGPHRARAVDGRPSSAGANPARA